MGIINPFDVKARRLYHLQHAIRAEAGDAQCGVTVAPVVVLGKINQLSLPAVKHATAESISSVQIGKLDLVECTPLVHFAKIKRKQRRLPAARACSDIEASTTRAN